MANKLLIVHGYSDGSTSFTALGDFFIGQGVYPPDNVYYLDYSSMDDDATFEDFADKLDADHRARLGGERIDVVCHSTGSLVVRAWLALHAERAFLRRQPEPCPVDRLLCFAPANFGSDLAKLGQSFLGKFRTTFFNSHSHSEDFLESGKRVLQGLEPASPFQWRLSMLDLHGPRTYFSDRHERDRQCYPFVLAAGTGYGGLQARIIKERAMRGTDGTVRIAGTSLNTRHCTLDFRDQGAMLFWWEGDGFRAKYHEIPFAVFADLNHGSIVDPSTPAFQAPEGPGALAIAALREVHDLDGYRAMATRFREASESNYARLAPEDQGRYQQIFFRVRDDVDLPVEDFYVDFYVLGPDGKPDEELTLRFDEDFKANIYRHSASGAHRVMMLDCSKLAQFGARLTQTGAKLVLEVSGASPLPDVRYQVSAYDAFNPAAPPRPDEPSLLYPNTTTLVDVVLNRRQTDKLLQIKDRHLASLAVGTAAAVVPRTGRAELLRPDR